MLDAIQETETSKTNRCCPVLLSTGEGEKVPTMVGLGGHLGKRQEAQAARGAHPAPLLLLIHPPRAGSGRDG